LRVPHPTYPDPVLSPELEKLKAYLIGAVLREMESRPPRATDHKEAVARWLEEAYARTKVQLPDAQRLRVFRQAMDELVGYGPIQPLLDDAEISEVMVDGPRQVYVERNGELFDTEVVFQDEDHLHRIIDRILSPLGRRVDAEHPAVDARLPDGSRVNIVIPPVAIQGPCITIRKFLKNKLTVDQLLELSSLTTHMAEFLQACVVARLNILVSGNTSSGKTTLLNILTGFIPGSERIITIEDAVELQLKQKYIVRLETRNPDVDGKGEVTPRDLVRNALRMRPDRIIVGEVRGGEALDMLQAMNTGHSGSITTLHANTPRDATSRLETMAMMAGLELPLLAIRKQIASAIHLVVHMARLQDGTRKIVQITEIPGMEGEVITMQDIFKFDATGVTQDGKIKGEMRPTGIRPLFTPRLEAVGYRLRGEIFGAGRV
jgi:pilus assembly protein CpaF